MDKGNTLLCFYSYQISANNAYRNHWEWCRFGCPQAAVLGILQKYFSRFRITVNGGQCISCGNCSTYCEMGIDVKWYAQREQNIVRASCVGCGFFSAVCPRGVLKLEGGPTNNKTVIDINRMGVKVLDELITYYLIVFKKRG